MPQLASKTRDVGTLELFVRLLAAEIREEVKVCRAVDGELERARTQPVDNTCVEDQLRIYCQLVGSPLAYSRVAYEDLEHIVTILEAGARAIVVFTRMVQYIPDDVRAVIVAKCLSEAENQPTEARLRELKSHQVLAQIRRSVAAGKSLRLLELLDMDWQALQFPNRGITFNTDQESKLSWEAFHGPQRQLRPAQ